MCSIVFTHAAAPARGAESAFDQQVASYKAAKEKIEPADFELPPIPDADNAAIDLHKAAAAVDTKTPTWAAMEFVNDPRPPLSESEIATFRDLAKENVKTIALLDSAMTRKGVDWQIKMTSPVFEVLLPHLSHQRRLASALGPLALLDHHDGKDGEAIKDIQRILFIARANDQQGFMVGHLVGVSVSVVAVDALEKISPGLKIGAAPAASVEQVKRAIVSLLDDQAWRAGMREALLSERMGAADMTRAFVNGKLDWRKLGGKSDGKAPALAREQVEADGVLLMKFATETVQAFDGTKNYPSAMAAWPKLPPEIMTDRVTHAFAAQVAPALDRVIKAHYRAQTERHLAATGLAVRAYAAAHGGAFPKQLADLVPEYFPAVPDDPMTDGQPLKYDAAGGIVYSVGDDGKDDGGTGKPVASQTRWGQKDVVTRLKPYPG